LKFGKNSDIKWSQQVIDSKLGIGGQGTDVESEIHLDVWRIENEGSKRSD
jgi:hypothetical protein